MKKTLKALMSFVQVCSLVFMSSVGCAVEKQPVGTVGGHSAFWAKSSLSQTKVIQGGDGLVYMQVDMQTPAEDRGERKRKPTDFVVVLDRSGSMADARKMDYAKKAIDLFIHQLKEGDRFSLVTFDNVVQVPISLREYTGSSRESFLRTLRDVQPGGSTNLGGGLIRGIEEIKRARGKEGQAQKLVLLSDGLANEGIVDQRQLNQIAEKAVSGTFAISTIGVGLDFNENLMASLADYGHGNYTFLEDLAALDKVLAQEFLGASQVWANDVRVQLSLDPQVEIVEAAGYPVERNGSLVTVRAGHLYQDQGKTVFVTLRLPTGYPYTRSLGSAFLSYEKNGEIRKSNLFGEELIVACVTPERREEARASINTNTFKEAWTKNNYGKLLKDNAERVKQGDRAGAMSAIGSYKSGLQQAYEAAPSPEMKQQLDDLSKMEGEVNAALTGPDADMKAKRLSKGYQYQGIQKQRSAN